MTAALSNMTPADLLWALGVAILFIASVYFAERQTK